MFIVRPMDFRDAERAEAKQRLGELWDFFLSTDDKRISTDDLFTNAGVTQASFEAMINSILRRPTVVLQRSLAELWVNGYNIHLLRSWDANIDLQFVLDSYR